MQINHILAKAHQHLRGGLAVNAAVDVGLAGKIVRQLPVVRDGVAEKYDSILVRGGSFERGVGVAVSCQFAEVVGIDGDAGCTVLVEAGVAGGGNDGRWWRGLLADRRKNEQKYGGQKSVDSVER